MTIYTFAQTVDDIADGLDSATEKLARLMAWRQAVSSLATVQEPYGAGLGSNELILLQDMQTLRTRFDVPDMAWIRFIDSLSLEVRAAPFVFVNREDINDYLDASAAALADLVLPVVGAGDAPARTYVHALSKAIKAAHLYRDFTRYGLAGVVYASATPLSPPDGALSYAWLQRTDVQQERRYLHTVAQGYLHQARALWPQARRAKLMPVYMVQTMYEGMLACL